MLATSTMLTCPSGPTIQTQTPADQNDDFFLFGNSATETETAVDRVDRECYSYLSDSGTGFDILSKYDTLRYLFLKFNTALPSSAPVEWMFSMAGQIQTPRRNLLSDKMFEKLLLLKINSHLITRD